MTIEAQLPDGRVLEFPDGTPTSVVQATVKRLLAPAAPTMGGQVKEAFKGLVPGAVGMLETAAIGASALLPEQYEAPVREAIGSVAGAAKAPFAAAPGYEDTVGRKLGEAGGSILPFLALGPAGVAGRLAAAGIGVGAGAGEARVRAEQGKATEGERAAATALGTIPGALEVFAPFRILGRLPDEITGGGVQLVKRALTAGGEEAAQEAASGFAQNLIAQGIYKPDQELIEGLGEQAAYGGAVGAIAQGVLDLALGRRARGAGEQAPTEAEQAEIEAQRLREAEREQAPAAPEVSPAELSYGELEQRRQALLAEGTPAAAAQAAEIAQAQTELNAQMVRARREADAQAARDAQLAGQSAFAVTDPQQMEMGGMGEPGTLPQPPAAPEPAALTQKQLEAAGQRRLPLTITPEGQPTTERPPVSPQREFGGFGMAGTLPQAPVAPEPAPPTQKELEAAGQQRLPLRRTPAGQPTTSLTQEPVVEPTAPTAPVEDGIPEPTIRRKPELLTHPAINEENLAKGTLNWVKTKRGQEFLSGVLQLDPAQAQARRSEFVNKRQTVRGEIFDAIYPDSVAAPAVRDDIRPEQEVVGEPAEPSVGVPVPSGPDQAGAQLTEPSDGAGVGAVPGTAGAEPVVEGASPAAVTAKQLIQNVEYAKSEEDYYAALVALAEARNTDPVVDAYIEREYGDTNTPTPAQQAFRKEYNQAPAKVAEARMGPAYGIEPEEVTQPYTAGELRSEVSDFVRAPVPEHKLKVVDSVEELLGSRDANEVEVGRALQREGAFGVASNGRAYLVANRIQKGQGRAKFMHEVGAHLGLEGLLPTSLYKRLTNQLKQWAESGANTDEVGLAKRAMQRVQAAQTPDADRDAELLAYFVEEAVQAGVDPTATQGGGPLRQWFRALWAAFKVALRKLGMKPETLTAQDVVNLAFGAARLELAGTYHGTAAQFRNFRNKYIGSGEGATAFGWGTYLAQRAGIAEGYWKADVARKSGPRQKPLTRPANLTGYERAYYDRIATQFGNNTVDKWDRYITQVAPKELSPDELAVAKALDTKVRTANDFTFDGPEGSFMRVDTAVEDSRMFDYDKSLDDQHPEVRGKLMAALEPLADEIVDRTNLEVGELTGEDLIGSSERNLGLLSKLIMGDALAPAGYDAQFDAAVSRGEFHEAASHYLRTLGLDGVKFLDAMSRKAAPKLLVVNGKEYTRDDLVDSARNDPEGLGQYAATLRTALRSGVDAAKDELRAKVDDTYRMLANIEVESAERYGVPVDAKAIRERATAEALDTYHGRQLAWLEGQEVRVKETPVTRTRNLVIFDDKNIFRAGTAVGADRQRMRFGKATPAERAAQAMQTVEELGNAAPVDPTAKEKLQAIYKDVTQNPLDVTRSAKDSVRNVVNTFGTNVWSSDFEFQANMRRALEQSGMAMPQITDFMLRMSTAQASNADSVATNALVLGAPRYDAETGLAKVVKSDNNVITLAQSLQAVAKKLGVTVADAERMWHTVTEAERLQDVNRFNNEVETIARQLDSKGRRQEATEQRKRLKVVHRTPAEIAQGLQLYELVPELRKTTKIWNTFKANIIDFMVDSGTMNRDMADDYIANAAYVPLYRVDQIADNQGPREYMSGLMVGKDPKFKGSYDPVNDVFDNVLRWAQFAVEKSVRNNQARKMVSGLQEIGAARPAAGLTKEELKRGEIVTVLQDGVKVPYQSDLPGTLTAFSGLESVSVPALKYFSKVADVLRQSIVLFPLFPVLQIPQDSFAAMFTSGLKPRYALTIPARAIKEFVKTLRNTSQTHKDLKKYAAVGRRDVTSAVRRNDLEVAAGLKAAPGLKGFVLDKLHHLSMASDSAVRQAVYEASLAQGLSKSEAIQKSFDLINFRYRGTSKLMSLASQTIPFFNAYSAATYVAFKTLTGQGVSPTARAEAGKTFAQTFAVTAALSLVYAMLIGDDEDYQNTPARERDRSLMIPGTGVGIPLRPDIFLLPKILAEHMYQLSLEEGTSDPAKFRAAVTQSLLNTVLSPTTVPQAIKPALEVGINYNFFTMRPLVGPFEQQKAASLQFNEYTSEFSKSFAAGLGMDSISPTKLDHFIRGTFGSVGAALLWSTNQIMDPEYGGEKADLTWRDAVATFPGMGAVVRNTNETGRKTDFYELREATRKANTTYLALEANMPQLVENYVTDPKIAARLELAATVEDLNGELASLRQYRQAIVADPELTGEEKRVQLQDLADYERELLEAADLRGMRTQAQL